MGWFDEQIRQRKNADDEAFTQAFVNMAGAVMGERFSAALNGDRAATRNAIEEILKFYRVKSREVPDAADDVNEQLEYLLHPYGIMRRAVRLENGWYKNAVGAMLGAFREDGRSVALIPNGFSGYTFLDYKTGRRMRVNAGNQALFVPEALVFYQPFPLKKIGVPELARYIVGTLSFADLAAVAFCALAVSLVGLLTPMLNQLLFSAVVPSGSMRLLLAITVFMASVSLSTLLLSTARDMMTARVSAKMNISVQAAVMMRILSLPADFFKDYSAGELTERASYINALCGMLVSAVLGTGLTSIFSLVYLTQIAAYTPALALPAFAVILLTTVFSLISARLQMKLSRRQMELGGKESGMTYALITGVQKIKLAGAEKRAFARWGNLFAEHERLTYNPPVFLKLHSVLSLAISLAGAVVIYYEAVRSGVSVADYYAFNTAYGMVGGAFLSLSGIALTAARIRPVIELAKPLLSAVPEVSQGKQVLTHISGGVELSNVSFRYRQHMPLVLDDLSLKIRPGQYVAVVGKTGCGKSTLMRLLLGFETPQKGAVYYDGKDLSTIDLKSLRRRVGVVMQNGKLFQGDIYENIVVSAPWLTREEAWEAAELAGIAEDIRRMPMGMNTVISEGTGGISGGQRQRLMIARAIAPKPKLLIFDEATSALDNLTQKRVSESLKSIKSTRIVIAHRLSTIRECDRVIVLDKGKIIEDGTYDELLQKNGFFAELVARQRLDYADPAAATAGLSKNA